jgi:NADH-quinone oxidoreductase subunit G
MQEGEPFLAATARQVGASMSARTAASLDHPSQVRVIGPGGSIVLPVQVAEVIDNVVVLPMNSPGCSIYRDLGARIGDAVGLITVQRHEGEGS